ncbi:MAG: tRNA lysidine(34) synthetase TilS [Phycisphaeraceae bacterium]|nr:tRNA lysidine(34) synthetase TilS [Phycisphaeraceae bacterium]
MTRRTSMSTGRLGTPFTARTRQVVLRTLGPESRALVRAATLAWRRQTTPPGQRRAGPGQPTVVALSGGADSSGLLIALVLGAGASKFLAVHVVHDLRSAAEADADALACAELCGRLGVELTVGRIRVRETDRGPENVRSVSRDSRNLEARARRLRYAALARAARFRGVRFIATAHHADDQLETVLMRLMRGAGLRGLSGIPTVRPIGDLSVIRPLLAGAIGGGSGAADGAALRRLCTEFGWKWREDATNMDPARLRAAIRMHVTPVLKSLRPGVAAAAIRSAVLLRAAGELVDDRVDVVCSRAERRCADQPGGSQIRWSREDLRRESAMVIGAVLRREVLRLSVGTNSVKEGRVGSKAMREELGGAEEDRAAKGADKLTARALAPAVRAIRDADTARRTFLLGHRIGGVRVTVTTKWVSVDR